MARNWKLLTFHGISHIHPTLTTGSAVSGFPVTNIRTLNPDLRARATDASVGGGNYVAYIDFDRATASALNGVNCCYIAGVSVKGSGHTFSLYDGATSTPSNALVSPDTLDFYQGKWYTFDASTQRYLRVAFANTTGGITYECGVVTVGFCHSIPGELFGSTIGPASDPRAEYSRSFTFRRVSQSDGETFMRRFGREYILRTDYQEQDGYGLSGGIKPGVVGYFTDAAAETENVWYGPMSMTLTETDQVYSTLTLAVDHLQVGALSA